MSDATMPSDDEELRLLEGFEHEFDVAIEHLRITKPIFDGRLGDPALTLKKKLARFVKFHFAKALHEAEVRARIEKYASNPCGYCGIPVPPVVMVTKKSYCNHSHRTLAYNQRIATLTAEKEKKV